jgi:hypothetical protein
MNDAVTLDRASGARVAAQPIATLPLPVHYQRRGSAFGG